LLGWQCGKLARRVLARRSFAALRRKEWVMEPQFGYWPEFESIPDHCCLSGYWQSEKYFKRYESAIRGEFAFRHPLDARNAELAAEIGSVSAVSLHVRRGDYSSNPKTRAIHGLCSLEYYRAAIEHIAKRVELPCFFVFSDDIGWARDHLDVGFRCSFIGHNQGERNFVDMHLMSLCKHHIIANSSFSWWGAWLNPDPEKTVIAPRRWFANDTPTGDLIPEEWVRL
jgi:hypothetical protein